MCSSRTSAPDSPILSELLQLDESLRTMDKTRFWFTGNNFYGGRSNFQRIKSIIPSTVAERRGTISATLALHLLEYLCNEKFPQITRLRKTDHDLRMIRNVPWAWRRRFMAIKPARSKLDKGGGAGVPIEHCFNIVFRSRWHYDRRSVVQHLHYDSLSNLIYVLDRLPTLLKHAAEDKDLIAFVSRHTIFPQQAFHIPRLRERAQNAVNVYLAKFPQAANPPPIPLPECFVEGPDERWEHKLGRLWDKICILFPHFLAFLVYICFFWVTFFA